MSAPSLYSDSASEHVAGSTASTDAPQLTMRRAAELGLVPIIEVAFKNGMWWPIPKEMSRLLYERYEAGEDAASGLFKNFVLKLQNTTDCSKCFSICHTPWHKK